MEDQNSKSPADITFEVVMEQFQGSMLALQVQDVHTAEKSLLIAKNAFSSIEGKNEEIEIEPDEWQILRVLVGYIEIVTMILRSSFFILDERYEKAKSEQEKVIKIIESTKNSLEELIKADIALGGLTHFLSFMLKCFHIMVHDQYISTLVLIDRENGKYVDEVNRKQERVKELRKINNITFEVSEEFSVFVIGMVNMINKLADREEMQIERLIDRNKHISFLNPIGNNVFLIHGHAKGEVREFKELMEKHFKIKPIILADEPNSGKTIIEQIERYGMRTAFAFSILTPDDWVKNNGKEYFQARPNVLFELGWFCGRYGREKVRIIMQKGTELPSDLGGLITINFNENIEEVFLRIKAELEEFGLI